MRVLKVEVVLWAICKSIPNKLSGATVSRREASLGYAISFAVKMADRLVLAL